MDPGEVGDDLRPNSPQILWFMWGIAPQPPSLFQVGDRFYDSPGFLSFLGLHSQLKGARVGWIMGSSSDH